MLAHLRTAMFSRNPVLPRNQSTLAGFYDAGQSDRTVTVLMDQWIKKMDENSIADSRESVANIVAHIMGTNKLSDLYRYKHRVMSKDEVNQIDAMCQKRMENLPIEYVLGEWDFRNLKLKMIPPVFIPWPETEQLIDVVLAEIDRKGCDQVLDMCCGSGAIVLALLEERPNIRATAVDRSEEACNLTKENAKRHGLLNRLTVVQCHLDFSNPPPLAGNKFDVIVSNAPYVPANAYDYFHKKNEDGRAINGGQDGLDVIKLVVKLSTDLLNKGGKLVLEVNPTHPPLIQKHLKQNQLGLKYDTCYKDFANLDRYVVLTKC